MQYDRIIHLFLCTRYVQDGSPRRDILNVLQYQFSKINIQDEQHLYTRTTYEWKGKYRIYVIHLKRENAQIPWQK